MTSATYQLDCKGHGYDVPGVGQIIVSKNLNNLKKYDVYQHFDTYTKLKKNINFIINYKSKNYNIDSSGLVSDNYKINGLVVYFRKRENYDDPVVIGIVIQPEGGTLSRSGQFKKYYSWREFLSSSGTVKLSSISVISTGEIEEKHLDNEYEALFNTLKLDIHQKVQYTNIKVEGPESISDLKSYNKYTHSPYGYKYNKIEIKCSGFNGCNFSDIDGSEYNDTNLEQIVVYIRESQSNNTEVPLLVEFKPKRGKKCGKNDNGKSVYYELNSIEKNGHEDEPSKWTKNYTITSTEDQIAEKLEQIYNGKLKQDIDEIIYVNDSTATAVGTGVGAVLGVGAIGTGVAYYKYPEFFMSLIGK